MTVIRTERCTWNPATLRKTFLPLSIIVMLGAVLRVGALTYFTGAIDAEGAEYARIAENLLAGNGYRGIVTPGVELMFPPLYPLLIAATAAAVKDADAARRICPAVGAACLVAMFAASAMTVDDPVGGRGRESLPTKVAGLWLRRHRAGLVTVMDTQTNLAFHAGAEFVYIPERKSSEEDLDRRLAGIFSSFRPAPRESGNYGRATNAFLSIAPARPSDTSAKKFDGDDKGHYTMREIRDGRAIPTMLFLCSDEEARGFEWGFNFLRRRWALWSCRGFPGSRQLFSPNEQQGEPQLL